MFLQKLFWWHCFNSYWVEVLMIKKLITLFKLARKIAKSDILNIASKFKKPPLAITILFQLTYQFHFLKKNQQNILIQDEGERLSSSLENMGTTFHKAWTIFSDKTRYYWRRIIISKLENLQDRLTSIFHKSKLKK